MRSRSWDFSKGELLALFFGLQKFTHVLRGQEFLVWTDNLSVRYWESAALSSNPILSRWLDFIADFQFKIVHVKGKFMIPADTLLHLIRRNDEEAEGGGGSSSA